MTGFEKDYTITVVPNPHRGDANTDGEVTLADAILIMQVIANPDKYDTEGSAPNHITPYGKGNADVNGSLGYSDIHDGLTVKDALDIQMYMLGLIDSLNSWLLDK